MRMLVAGHFKLGLTLFALLALGAQLNAQRVGVVLSGGGARAAAHVGFLKALEEHDIPIDYIGGTSMGAIVGAMYASGYTIAEIDSIMRSDDYIRVAKGDIDEELRYYYKDFDRDASMGSVKLSRENIISSTLPTNLVNPALFDYNLMAGFGPAAAAANYNFDSLYIPFRCVAADVGRKEAVVFRSGDLASAVRASMTYPFYIPPINIDGRLLFDGGLYNNFPSDIIYDDFLPDVILGSNVSSNSIEPHPDDLFSQLKSMIVFETNFESLCEDMMIVDHELEVGTFDFDDIGLAIDRGYANAIANMDSIKAVVSRRTTADDRVAKRRAFRMKMHPMIFDEIAITGLDRSQRNYVKGFFNRRTETMRPDRLQKEYFRILADHRIHSIYPTARFKPAQQTYALTMDVRREKDILFSAGGNFSSRPINAGYINARYNLFGRVGATLNVNSYFGKFYGSVHASARFDFPSTVPIAVEPFFTLNRWDYFSSFTTFFEEVRPSYIVINEQFGGLRVRIPVNNKGRIDFIGNAATIEDDYYRTTSFLATDTADRTKFNAFVGDVIYERSTLNRKAFANAGTFLKFQLKATVGEELTIPGTTSLNRDTIRTNREWFMAKVHYTNYFTRFGPFKAGILLEGVVSTQPLFQNTRASLISAQAFQPVAESTTFFLPQFRAHNYAAGGLMLVTRFTNAIDLRFEGYAFVANGRILEGAGGRPTYDFNLRPTFIGSTSLVLQSPLGPISLALNYYELKDKPWSFIFNFGYLIFNRSVRHS